MMEPTELRIDEIAIPESNLRSDVDAQGLEGLTASLTEVGLLQPILVRESEGAYELVAGHRRLLAAKQAGFTTISALILAPDIDTLQVQLIENLQREDLNPIDRAEAVHAFMTLHKLTKTDAAQRLGVPRTTLTDWLNLLEIPPRFRQAVIDNFYGGDSPLTTSHVCEALGLARKLNSPGLSDVLLDAVLRHKLSKAETREVARIIREHRDTSIDEAIRAIRYPYYLDEEEMAAAADEVYLLPHEENMKMLVQTLVRSTRTLERMNHLSGRFLDKEQLTRLADYYLHILELSERALTRLRMEDPELLKRIEREEKQRTMRKMVAKKRRGKVS